MVLIIETKKFYFITVFSNYDGYGAPDTRCWGFYDNWDDANEVLHYNMTDLWKHYYTYGVIEEYEIGISNHTFRRWFYKYDINTNTYNIIKEPEELKHICCFSIGQKRGI